MADRVGHFLETQAMVRRTPGRNHLGRVDDAHVDRDEVGIGASFDFLQDPLQHHLGSALPEFSHRVVAHALVTQPLQCVSIYRGPA